MFKTTLKLLLIVMVLFVSFGALTVWSATSTSPSKTTVVAVEPTLLDSTRQTAVKSFEKIVSLIHLTSSRMTVIVKKKNLGKLNTKNFYATVLPELEKNLDLVSGLIENANIITENEADTLATLKLQITKKRDKANYLEQNRKIALKAFSYIKEAEALGLKTVQFPDGSKMAVKLARSAANTEFETLATELQIVASDLMRQNMVYNNKINRALTGRKLISSLRSKSEQLKVDVTRLRENVKTTSVSLNINGLEKMMAAISKDMQLVKDFKQKETFKKEIANQLSCNSDGGSILGKMKLPATTLSVEERLKSVQIPVSFQIN